MNDKIKIKTIKKMKPGCNVRIRRINKNTGVVLEEEYLHNYGTSCVGMNEFTQSKCVLPGSSGMEGCGGVNKVVNYATQNLKILKCLIWGILFLWNENFLGGKIIIKKIETKSPRTKIK